MYLFYRCNEFPVIKIRDPGRNHLILNFNLIPDLKVGAIEGWGNP